ncbi:ATP-dependent helicase [Peribacillus sp. SCS-155]|uniref:ATP-dependent helicase n=1 Tax=Peribacillus sedimenti TaxID=3115297 RepID=UPI0039062121
MNAPTGQNALPLELLSSEQLQALYEKGRRGELPCPICGELVRVKIGIHEAPSYLHHTKNSTCPGNTRILEASKQETFDYKEHNGFRIPLARNINGTTDSATSYKAHQTIKSKSAFNNQAPSPAKMRDTYISLLAEQGVELDKQQHTAAVSIDGPLLVLSGAGSGKTRVLTVRTAYMIVERNIDPRSIMLVTFTAKAASEMKERLLAYPGLGSAKVNQLVCGTFHSIFFKLLMFHQPGKWQRDLLIKWDWEKEKIIKEAGRQISLDEKEFAFDQALQQIGFWKNSLVFPESIKAADDWEKSCAFLYAKYEEYKKKTGKYDFDDMLTGCYLLLLENPDLLELYQQRFNYFLVDEFQDINKVQYELIKMLSAKSGNICAVGDDDQAIYSFRGSDPSFILNFPHDFPEAKIVKLTENYRSSHEIVSAANEIIKRNKNRMKKTMKAQHNFAMPPVMFFPYDEEIEATMILTDIQDKMADGANPGDFAILYRTHSMSRAIFERLVSSNLPFKIDRDAESFYDRKIVRAMLAFLRLSIDPHNQKAVSDILSSLFLKQSVLQDMKAQSILQDCDYIESFSHIRTGHAFQEKRLRMMPKQLRSLKNLRPSVALEIIQKDMGFQDYVKKRGNEGSIEKGSDDIRDLKVAAKRFDTAAEFLEHVDHVTAQNKALKQMAFKENDAVQLTTIHRAKGLEYKTVYVLSAVDGSLPHDFALDAHRKGESDALEEERRLMYVAATRAKEHLYISVPQTRRGKTAHPSRFLKF